MTALEALLKYQKQCDPEGMEVQVSRQALDEVLRDYELQSSECRILREALERQVEQGYYEPDATANAKEALSAVSGRQS